MTDFTSTLIRCSSLSCLFTEPQSKADKEAGKLSKTAQSHLIEVYANAIWGVDKELMTKEMEKGIYSEEDGITLLSRVDKQMYVKNTDRFENEWISGHPDIITDEMVIDLKLSWSPFSFLPKLIEDVDKCYYYQVIGYMWLTGLNKARISYGLVSTPEHLIEAEKWKLLRQMNVATEEAPEFKKEWEKRLKNYHFDHIPIEQRVISHFVDRDDEIIAKIPEKVERARNFLQELQNIHLK